MRKSNIVVMICIVIVMFFFLFSCNNTLTSPNGLLLNNDEVLKWDKVDGASSYEISLNNKLLYTEENEIDLFNEIVEPVDYEIKVRALSNNIQNDSEYSNMISYHVPSLLNFSVGLNSNNEYAITKIKAKEIRGKFYIPKEYEGHRITKIDSNCFEECNELTGLICDGIEELSSYVFKNCQNLRMINALNAKKIGLSFENCSKLEKIILGDSLEKIAPNAFYNTKIKEIYLSDKITNLSPTIFEGCNKLEKIVIASDNQNYYVENNCIMSYKNNKLIRGFSNSIIPNNTKILGDNAFSGLNIKRIDIPNGVEKIEYNCFANCTLLEDVIFPDSLLEIGSNSFDSCCSLKEIRFSSKINDIKPGVFKNCKNIESISIENNDKYYMINNCIVDKQNGSIVLGCKNSIIPKSNLVNSIASGAFCNVGIRRMVIPANIKTIGKNAFNKCEDLEELILEEGIELIEQGAFSRCYKLKTVVIPRTVKNSYGFENNKCQIIAFADTVFYTRNDFNFAYYYLEGTISNNTGNSYINPILDCEIIYDEDEYYVSSISTNNSFSFDFVVPYRKGYKFLGWSISKNKEDIVTEIMNISIVDYTFSDEGRELDNEFVAVSRFDLSVDYSNCRRFYSIWEKENI